MKTVVLAKIVEFSWGGWGIVNPESKKLPNFLRVRYIFYANIIRENINIIPGRSAE